MYIAGRTNPNYAIGIVIFSFSKKNWGSGSNVDSEPRVRDVYTELSGMHLSEKPANRWAIQKLGFQNITVGVDGR